MEIREPVMIGFAAYTLLYLAYQAVSVPVNFTGRSFDLAAHERLITAWRPPAYPGVDIFLPVCGEPIEVLRNTWEGVFELIHAYSGRAVAHALDDGDSDEVAAIAPSFGFGRRCLSRITRSPGISTTPSPAQAPSTSRSLTRTSGREPTTWTRRCPTLTTRL